MCGLAGWFDLEDPLPPPPEPARRAALDALAGRGPDGEGSLVVAGAGLLHRRLAVVDLEGGAQPMAGPAPGQWLAWNGELFDHAARRAGLEATGTRFRTRSDTEVAAHLLAGGGADALSRTPSQYALAWLTGAPPEAEAGRESGGPAGEGAALLLARDPMGEKPLYHLRDGQRIWFASTLEALVALARPVRELCPEALSLYLSWGFVPAPLTILQGVRKLRAGEWLHARRGEGVTTGRVDRTPAARVAADPCASLHEALAAAARCRLESSDVPVGVFLSGGLDSLAVAAVLRDHGSMRTFTVRSRDLDQDESAAAARVAAALGLEHEVIDPPPDDPDEWRTALLRYGEPFGSASAVAVDVVARAARRHVKVVLTGDGGDEALGGYPRHVLLRRLSRVPRVPAAGGRMPARLRRLRRAADLIALTAADRQAEMYEVFGRWRTRLVPGDDGSAARELIRGIWRDAPAGDLDAMLRVDRELELPDSHCVKVDVACMGNGVEPRSPWLDPRVTAVCDAYPQAERLRGGRTKRPLRELLRRELPEDVGREVLSRRKRGFSTGFGSALRSPGARDMLLGGPLRRVPGIDLSVVEEMLAEHHEDRGNHVFRLCTLVGLAVFADAHLG